MSNLRKLSLNGEQYGNSDFRQAVEMKLFPNLTHIELFGSYTPTEEFLSVWIQKVYLPYAVFYLTGLLRVISVQ